YDQSNFILICFFFQAEDGIRYRNVTGVQTCALPILSQHILNQTYNIAMKINNILRNIFMKSKDTLKWFPAQLPEVRIILGNAVVEVAKQGRPINTRTLLDYIEGNIKKKSWLDNKELLQTAISVLKDNQNLNGKM